MKEGKLSGFTNEKGLRSELGFIIPSDLLVETLKISTINGRNLFEDIIVEEPKRGRKWQIFSTLFFWQIYLFVIKLYCLKRNSF